MEPTTKLPPLPDGTSILAQPQGGRRTVYTADDMHAYALAAIAAQPAQARAGEPRCADCDVVGGCPEYCHCGPTGPFYSAFNAFARNCGHKPTAYDVWLMASGAMDANGRATPPAASRAAPAAKALEFAEYMAKGAEQLLDKLATEDELRIRREESDDVDADTVYDAACTRGEFMTGLRADVYEFRKRAAKVAASPAVAAPVAAREAPADERAAFEALADSMNYAIHRDETDKYKDYHRATTRFAREGWLSALAWYTRRAALAQAPAPAPSPDAQDAARKLAAFGAKMLRAHRGYEACEVGDIDGGTAQDEAIACGVLETREVTEPCGESCVCAGVDDFPQRCYFIPDDVRALLAAAPGEQP